MKDATPPKPYANGHLPMVGDRVKITKSEMDMFTLAVQNKIRDRAAVVRLLTYPSSKPVLIFPAEGRKKEYNFGQCESSWLELVDRKPE